MRPHRYTNVAAMGGLPTPLQIMGANLVAWWNTDSTSQITIATGVSSWKDDIANIDLVQATGALQPVYSATSFGGRPGITTDGATTFLRAAATPASFPIGAAYSEVWVCASQNRLGTSAGIENIFGYGGASVSARLARRTTGSNINRANCIATSVSSSNVTVDYSGRHYTRCIFSPTAVQQDVDGTSGPSAAVIPATATGNVTLGTGNAAVPTGYSLITAHQVIVLDTTPSAGQITALNAYFAARL